MTVGRRWTVRCSGRDRLPGRATGDRPSERRRQPARVLRAQLDEVRGGLVHELDELDHPRVVSDQRRPRRRDRTPDPRTSPHGRDARSHRCDFKNRGRSLVGRRSNPKDSQGRNEMYSAVAAGSPLWSPRSTRPRYPDRSPGARPHQRRRQERVTGIGRSVGYDLMMTRAPISTSSKSSSESSMYMRMHPCDA